MSAQNVVSSSTNMVPDAQAQAVQVLSNMGIHPTNLGGMMAKLNLLIALVYQNVSSFALTYGAMFLIIGAFAWLIAWKFHATTMQSWAKRVVLGVFVSEVIVVLLPQAYFSLLSFLSHA